MHGQNGKQNNELVSEYLLRMTHGSRSLGLLSPDRAEGATTLTGNLWTAPDGTCGDGMQAFLAGGSVFS